MLKHYFKIAWQSLLRQRLNSFINISGLSIGMAASVMIFMWVNNELNFDNYHKDSKNIYRVKTFLAIDKKQTWILETSPYLLGDEMQKKLPEILSIARMSPFYRGAHFNVKGEFTKEDHCAYVDSLWFSFFHYDFVRGNPSNFNNYPFSMILTESKSKKYFGNEDPIGKKVRIDTLDYEIRGVVKDNPPNSSFQYDVLIPLAAHFSNPANRKNDESWGNFHYLTFIKTLPTASMKELPAKVTTIIQEQKKKDDIQLGLVPIADMHFENDLRTSSFEHSDKKVVFIFALLGILLLLIACINYVNLSTARASLRAKEVSVKKITGAGRGQLFLQFIFESALVSVISLLVTLVMVKLALPSFNQFTGKNFALAFGNKWLWMIMTGTLLASIVLTSIYPAMLLSSFKPILIFRGLNALRIKDTSLRKGLVVVQFTIAIMLMVGTIVIYKQLNFINHQGTAYDRSQVLSFSIPFEIMMKYKDDGRTQFVNSVKQELQKEIPVKEISVMNQNSIVNMNGFSAGESTDWDGRNKGFTPAIAFFSVDNDFNKLMNLEMAAGRWFKPDNADKQNSILNETAVKLFNIRQPVIGRRFTAQGDTGVIVGVVKDFYYKSMHEKIGPVVIRNGGKYNSTFLVKSEKGKTTEAQMAAKKIWTKFFPNQPFEYKFIDEEFEKLYRADQKTASLVWLFSGLAIFLSCLGLFGLAAFTAERRTREIGVRKVLGATIPDIVNLVSREFILLVVISIIIASPLAWWAMNKWLEDFSYRINIAAWFFGAAGMVTMLIAVITVSFHAIKVAITNPVKSLRTE